MLNAKEGKPLQERPEAVLGTAELTDTDDIDHQFINIDTQNTAAKT